MNRICPKGKHGRTRVKRTLIETGVGNGTHFSAPPNTSVLPASFPGVRTWCCYRSCHLVLENLMRQFRGESLAESTLSAERDYLILLLLIHIFMPHSPFSFWDLDRTHRLRFTKPREAPNRGRRRKEECCGLIFQNIKGCFAYHTNIFVTSIFLLVNRSEPSPQFRNDSRALAIYCHALPNASSNCLLIHSFGPPGDLKLTTEYSSRCYLFAIYHVVKYDYLIVVFFLSCHCKHVGAMCSGSSMHPVNSSFWLCSFSGFGQSLIPWPPTPIDMFYSNSALAMFH